MVRDSGDLQVVNSADPFGWDFLVSMDFHLFGIFMFVGCLKSAPP